MSTSPLQGLRVLDLSKVLAGPICAQYLADMGADVIKVESPDGDETRAWPPFRVDAEGRRNGAIFLAANRNKRSLALDLRRPEGRDVVRRLAARSDVVIESFGPGVAARLGVDAETLHAAHPRLVCCRISGYGSVGPMRDGKGYDMVLQAFCGLTSMTGERDGPPVRAPYSPVDQATGAHAMGGILALLLERHRTGRGGIVDASLFDTATALASYYLQGLWIHGREPERSGSGHESLCPYQAFDTADRPIILGVANDGLWQRFCQAAGLQDWADRPGFATNAERVTRRAETVALVQAALRTRTRDDWLARLNDAGIPCSPLHSLGELASHPHTAASGMLRSHHDPRLGDWRSVAQPLRFDGERSARAEAPPACGADSEAVLREAGLSEAEIGRLRADGVLGAAG
ncbi:MAG: CoA transferase [Rubrivivax sp.]|nr:CoA transferase [Rubrivivax sp.]